MQTVAAENKMGSMPVNKLIWNMALPIILSMLVQALYNMVDSVFVSMINEESLTAVSLAFPVQNLIIGLSSGTAVGMNALFSRALGAKDQKRADTVAMNGVFLAIMGSIVCLIATFLISRPFMETQTEVAYIAEQGVTYLNICGGLSFGIFIGITFERLLQGTGRTVYAMYGQMGGAIINLILDPIFILVFDWGVAGAAYATVIGQIIGFGVHLWFNIKKNDDVHLSFRGFRPSLKIIGQIYAIGIPSVVMVAIGSVTTFCMNKILITYHIGKETAATVFGIYFKLNSLFFMPVFGLNNAIVPIIAYNYGAMNRRRMMKTMKLSITYAIGIMALGAAAFLFMPNTLLSFFHASDFMLQIGKPALQIIGPSFLLAGACISTISVFQALGHSIYSMFISFFRQIFFLLPTAYFLGRYGAESGKYDLVWLSYPLAEVIAISVTVFFMVRLYKKVIAHVPMDGPTADCQKG